MTLALSSSIIRVKVPKKYQMCPKNYLMPKGPKKCQKCQISFGMIKFSIWCQMSLKNAPKNEFGIKNANIATLKTSVIIAVEPKASLPASEW